MSETSQHDHQSVPSGAAASNLETATQAALHALDALPAAEAAAFEERLRRGQPRAGAEYHSFRLVADRLVEAAPPVAPPAGLKARLMAGVAGAEAKPAPAPMPAQGPMPAPAAEGAPAPHPEAIQVWRQWTSPAGGDGVFTLRSDETGWEKTDIDGIEVRNLFADRERNCVTMLVRMAPGTAYPTHRHAGVEECLVLEGDLRVPPGRHLHAGDYQRAAGDSLHGVQSTDTGCLLFIISSTEDELV